MGGCFFNEINESAYPLRAEGVIATARNGGLGISGSNAHVGLIMTKSAISPRPHGQKPTGAVGSMAAQLPMEGY
jgi:hypothetical protein